MSFRDLLHSLHELRGDQPRWPKLLGSLLDAEFLRQREIDDEYQGEIAIDRSSYERTSGNTESHRVADLFANTLEQDGCVSFCGERIRLLGFQWPTQGGNVEKGRRADLVGITQEGGLVVFEAKVEGGDPPLDALVQGLDYLACLHRSRNFAKLSSGLDENLKVPENLPAQFRGLLPNASARPWLIVLAPAAYYASYSRSRRGYEVPILQALGNTFIPSVRVGFAATDFNSTNFTLP